MSFTIDEFDPEDSDVKETLKGRICRHPDGNDRDPGIVSGVEYSGSDYQVRPEPEQ